MILHFKKKKELFDSIQKILSIRNEVFFFVLFFFLISDLSLVYCFILLPLSQSLLKLRHVHNTYVGSLLFAFGILIVSMCTKFANACPFQQGPTQSLKWTVEL